MKLKLVILTALAVVGLILPKLSLAADFSVRLGQPKTPTNQNNFKLTFVALDTRDDRNITVKCFKKGPADSGFTQFDVNKVLIEGGNTDYCGVTDSILNNNGSYSFYVTAEAGSVTLSSSTVIVDYNTSGPGTPNSYSKEKINSCDYKIKFRTADDGKTVKVQLFRSDTLNIAVGSSAVLTQQNIGPNTASEITNSVPTCGKDYYYVLRAVDSSDNASGTIGDSMTTTTTTTTTGSVNGTGANGQTGNTGALALNGASSQVSADGTGSDTSTSAVTDGSTSNGATPSVLGTDTDDKKGLAPWLQGLIAVLVIFIVFRKFRKTKSK